MSCEGKIERKILYFDWRIHSEMHFSILRLIHFKCMRFRGLFGEQNLAIPLNEGAQRFHFIMKFDFDANFPGKFSKQWKLNCSNSLHYVMGSMVYAMYRHIMHNQQTIIIIAICSIFYIVLMQWINFQCLYAFNIIIVIYWVEQIIIMYTIITWCALYVAACTM